MDAITAGAALIVVQLCVALVMAGTFYAVRHEKCTRYWALSGVFTALGVLLVVLNAGAPRYAVLLIGNNSLVFGVILQWWGLQAFYKIPASKAGWVIGAVFFLLFGWLLVIGAQVSERALLSSIGILTTFILCVREVWRGQRKRWTFAGRLTLGAGSLLLVAFVFRFAANLLKVTQFLPATSTSFGVTMVYLVPLAGTLLFSTGLFLLYFERLVQDKHHLATHDELTGLGRECAARVGERLVNALRQYRFNDTHPVTVSVGLALLPDTQHERSWVSLINRADKELYRAKAAGRNRFCIAVDLRGVAAAGREPDATIGAK